MTPNPTNWTISDIHSVEKTPASPGYIQGQISGLVFNSTTCRCKVETINPTTGEYRIVLQGTLDMTGGNFSPNFNG
jgi:hypothetical protein